MISPQFPQNESQRLDAVKRYSLLDTLPEEDFDNITKLISTICEVPISLITLLDLERNFLKSHHGIEISESPRSISFCGHAILSDDDIFIIEDAREDERFHDNPLVSEFQAVFYAGVPLINPQGFPLGTLCVYDHKPRKLTDEQKHALKTIAKQVMYLFELRKNNALLKSAKTDLETQNKFLNKFSGQVSHDLKSPLANISALTEFLKSENEATLSEESKEYIDMIEASATSLRLYIDGALRHYKANRNSESTREDFELISIFNNVSNMLNLKLKNFELTENKVIKHSNKAAITQVILNLVDNAFKYNPVAKTNVRLNATETEKHYKFTVSDNGIGIKNKDLIKIFDLFSTSNHKDANGKSGSGIGLFTVKSLVEKMGGEIKVDSTLNKGTSFSFTTTK